MEYITTVALKAQFLNYPAVLKFPIEAYLVKCGSANVLQTQVLQTFYRRKFYRRFADVLQTFYRRFADVLQTFCRRFYRLFTDFLQTSVKFYRRKRVCKKYFTDAFFTDVLQTRPFGRRGAIESVKKSVKK